MQGRISKLLRHPAVITIIGAFATGLVAYLANGILKDRLELSCEVRGPIAVLDTNTVNTMQIRVFIKVDSLLIPNIFVYKIFFCNSGNKDIDSFQIELNNKDKTSPIKYLTEIYNSSRVFITEKDSMKILFKHGYMNRNEQDSVFCLSDRLLSADVHGKSVEVKKTFTKEAELSGNQKTIPKDVYIYSILGITVLISISLLLGIYWSHRIRSLSSS